MKNNKDRHPHDDPVPIEIDPATEYVLIDILDRLLQTDTVLSEPYESAAVARLLSSLEGRGKSKNELTDGVKEHTELDGLPGVVYQEMLFQHYEEQTRRQH